MNKKGDSDAVNLINQARDELEKAYKMLDCLKVNLFSDGTKDALEIIENYISHAKDIVSWLKNAIEEEE